MNVRVVSVRERRWVSWLVTALAVGLIMALSSGTLDAPRWPWPSGGVDMRRVGIGLLLACWGGGTTLTWRPRPAPARVTFVRGGVLIGKLRFTARDAPAVSVARAAWGYSVAVGEVFLELETEADARRLLAALEVPWPGRGRVDMETHSPRMRLVQRLLGVAGAAFALGYALFIGVLDIGSKGTFALPALLLSAASTALLVLDTPRSGIVVGTTAGRGSSPVDTHARLHVEARVTNEERADEAHALGRGEDDHRAWLERIDAMALEGRGYRSALPPAEELERIVDDEGHAPDVRLAAARALARKHGHPLEDLKPRVGAELAPRLRVVIDDDVEEAAAGLDELGPVFRAGR